jgi:hypothetical protein
MVPIRSSCQEKVYCVLLVRFDMTPPMTGASLLSIRIMHRGIGNEWDRCTNNLYGITKQIQESDGDSRVIPRQKCLFVMPRSIAPCTEVVPVFYHIFSAWRKRLPHFGPCPITNPSGYSENCSDIHYGLNDPDENYKAM